MIQPPFFIIRNSIHSKPNGDDQLVSCTERREEDDESSDSNTADDENNLPISPVAIVHLVEISENQYMLDLANDTFIANFLTENEIDNEERSSCEGDDKTYVDGRAWKHLSQYSELVGKPISDDIPTTTSANNDTSFILLENNVKDVIYTLLSIDRLFAWQTLVDARERGHLSWKDIRTFLAVVRSNIPFMTHDGLLKHVVNTHLTFHQFVAFSRLVDEHLECIGQMSTDVPVDINIDDIFPTFDSMTQEEKKIELLASIKDKAVRTSAQAAGIVVPLPEEEDELVSDEWLVYIEWWTGNDDIRNAFCLRELKFFERDADARRRAIKSGVSLCGRHSKDPAKYEQYLRRFGCWYYGNNAQKDDEEDDNGASVTEERICLADATIHTHDFADHLATPPDMPNNFQNTSWRPSSAPVTMQQANISPCLDDISLSQFVTVEPARLGKADTQPPAVSRAPMEESKHDDTSTSSSSEEGSLSSEDSVVNELPLKRQLAVPVDKLPSRFRSVRNNTFMIVTKPSFRRRSLTRIITDIDKITAMVNKQKDVTKLRGIELLRSKVRLLIVLKRFIGINMQQLIDVAPDSVDIFKIKIAAPPPIPIKPKVDEPPPPPKPDNSLYKEMLEEAKSHYNKTLCRKALLAWRRHAQVEKKRREEQQLLEERMQKLYEKADAAYKRSLTARCFSALMDHAIRQREERAKAVPPETELVVEEIEEEPPIIAPPRIEEGNYRDMYDVDEQPCLGELDCMELVIGRNQQSSLDVVSKDEYNTHFANGVELSLEYSPRSPLERVEMLDEATLRQMKHAKLRGASNLFDVPAEFVGLPSLDDGDDSYKYIEYRGRHVNTGA